MDLNGDDQPSAYRTAPVPWRCCSFYLNHHQTVIKPAERAVWRADKMGKATLFKSVEGQGVFLLEGRELPMRAGDLLVALDGVPHGVHNTGRNRLLVLAILAPPRGEP
jgi:mannose-6-phosphate isomerase-like protein (cupin superfamily)